MEGPIDPVMLDTPARGATSPKMLDFEDIDSQDIDLGDLTAVEEISTLFLINNKKHYLSYLILIIVFCT